MSLWRRSEPTSSGAESNEDQSAEAAEVTGERGIPPYDTFKSVQSRVSSLLTVTLMLVLSAGLLVWYYASAIGRHSKDRNAAMAAEQRRAQGESTLPPLPAFRQPRLVANGSSHPDGAGHNASAYDGALEQILGAPPALPLQTQDASEIRAPIRGAPPKKTPAQLANDRRMAGPVLTQTGGEITRPARSLPATPGSAFAYANYTPSEGSQQRQEAQPQGPVTLESYLHATPTPAADARVLPTQRYLLPKGAFIDCTLETAISSSLPGMTTCVTATDTFSSDGTVVLLERGTKLVGETRGVVQAGSPRLFVLWSEARTPAGIVVPLASPGTDELGRSGLTGSIDWHWWQRFGAALLVTIIDGAVIAAENRSTSTSVQVNPSGASDVMTEVLRGTLAIPPTINKAQGDRIEILVARDVDFRPVYQLRTQVGEVY